MGGVRLVKLANSDTRYSIAMRNRLVELLDGGCPCGGDTARLTQRLINASVTIHLQCATCGRSIAGSLPRREFYFFQDYPEWDAELQERYWREEKGRAGEYQQARAQAFAERRAAYEAWLAESPEWLLLRSLVLNRAEEVCEACLVNRATQVHHLTYSYGKIPPAWELKAVCRDCHGKLHEEWKRGAASRETERRISDILGT